MLPHLIHRLQVATSHARTGMPHTVLALHCSGSTGAQWEPYRSAMSGAVLRAPDLLGYGANDAWTPANRITLESEARRALDAAGASGPLAIVGHSYGGAVALQAALIAPQRVRSLTLYEPVLFHLLFAHAASQVQADEIRALVGNIDALLQAGEEHAAAQRFVDYWAQGDAWSRMSAQGRYTLAARMPKVTAEFAALFNAQMNLRELAGVRFEIHLIHGDRSPEPVRRIVALIARALPRARVSCVNGGGHMAPINRHDAMTPLLFPAATAAITRDAFASTWRLRTA